MMKLCLLSGLVIDKGANSIIMCNTLYHGSCEKISLDNITHVTPLGQNSLVPNMADKSSRVFIGPGLNKTKALYIGAQYSPFGNEVYR